MPKHYKIDHEQALRNTANTICEHMCFVTDCPDRPCYKIEGLDIVSDEPCDMKCIALAKKILGYPNES